MAQGALSRTSAFPHCCLMSSLLRYSSSYLSEDADIRADLAHLQEQPARVGPEMILECARRAIWGVLYADDSCNRVAVATRVGADDGGLR